MVNVSVKCIHCRSENVVKMGKQPTNGTPRCKCNTCGKTFQTTYKNNGATPQTKQQIIKMSLNGSGIRDISRVLAISQNTVMSVLKKQKSSS
ncbi:MAG: IS1-like element transposase [Candidatus Bathyarchaeota archaeon]|uniref:IS1-like element transposase n=1 Tax=Candidatus Bathycorpusculum sp. TaxID=2994959 RepID=UPI00281D4710|nr:IS1-like element transposase [Candidatus Termiticorpusculum sp.]MCL2257251.1 IS1-like element transposase [Candidatus Termiticorpusculum sp.]MCL2292620.1 IS1-like element transposase [Candidatus Termiticorpusculum sp.]